MNEIIKTVDLYLKENEGCSIDVWDGCKWVELELLDNYGVVMQDNTILSYVLVTDGTKELGVNINIYNVWDGIYKDEFVEIQDLIGYQIGQAFYNWTLGNEVEKLANDNDVPLSDIVRYGCQSGVISELIYNWDIEFFYNRFKKEIDYLSDNKEIYKRTWRVVEEIALDIVNKVENK